MKSLTEQVRAALAGEILAGKYAPGDRLPPEREYAEHTGTSRVTVRRAYDQLEAAGIIVRRRPHGTCVADTFRAHTGPLESVGLITTLPHEFSGRFVAAVSRCCRELDALLVLGIPEPDTGPQQLEIAVRMATRGVKDLIVWGADRNFDFRVFERLRILGVNLVFFDQVLPGDFADYVGLDNRAAIRALLAKARADGAERMIFVNYSDLDVDTNAERQQAFEACLAETGCRGGSAERGDRGERSGIADAFQTPRRRARAVLRGPCPATGRTRRGRLAPADRSDGGGGCPGASGTTQKRREVARWSPPLRRGAGGTMRIFAQGWSDRKDGPGHRRIYYLKGCNLRCRWCASPESIAAQPELLFYPERAVGETLDYLCPHGAIKERTLDRSVCSGCADRACRQFRHSALEWAGRERTPEELEKEVLRLSAGWDDFGGVTFGGGEPTLQAPELLDCINRLKKHRIHTAIESNATTPEFPDVAREVDLAIADLKAGTPEVFHDCTGGELAPVLDHLAEAAERAPSLLVRVPVITGMNDSPQELDLIAEHLSGLHRRRLAARSEPLAVEVLKLHHYGEPKYQALDRKYELADRPEPEPEVIRRFGQALAAAGLTLQRN